VPAQARPPAGYESWGVCPFECCTYGEWTAEQDIDVHAARSERAPVVFRLSRDETAVLVAEKGISPWYETETGRMDVKEDGSDEWRAGSGNQYSLVEKSDYPIVQALLNQLMQHQPVKH